MYTHQVSDNRFYLINKAILKTVLPFVPLQHMKFLSILPIFTISAFLYILGYTSCFDILIILFYKYYISMKFHIPL